MFRGIQRLFIFRECWSNATPFTISCKINNKINLNFSPLIRYFLLLTFIGIYCFDLDTEITFSVRN